MSVSKFIMTLMNSRNQAHTFHLNTTSYAQHKALQKYYEGIVPLLDSYAETYMGTLNGRMTLKKLNTRNIQDPKKAKDYFKKLLVRIKKIKLPKDDALKSIQDDIEVLIKSTIYMLKLK
jgi:hypothetical protein